MKKIFSFLCIFVILVSCIVPVSAANDIGIENIDGPMSDYPSRYYVLYFDYGVGPSGRYILQCLSTQPYIERDTSIGSYYVVTSAGSKKASYYFANGVWYPHADDSIGSLNLPYNSLTWSSVDLSYNGTVLYQTDPNFFPKPLAEVVGESLTAEVSKIHQTMLTLTFCGVGCLALVVLLIVLKKVFRRFKVN